VNGKVADVYAWTPIGGEFVYEPATGIIRLGVAPTKTLSASPRTSERTVGAALKVLILRAGFTLGELDLASFTALDAVFPDDFPTSIANAPNLYVADDRPLAQILDEILTGIGGFWTFTPSGLLRVGLLAFTTPSVTLEAPDVLGMPRRQRTLPPVWSLTTQYRRVWTVHGTNDLIGAASGFAEVQTEWRSGTTETAAVQTAHALARSLTVDTPFVHTFTGQAATLVRTNLTALLGVNRHLYTVPVRKHMFRRTLGETVTITHPRAPWTSGKNALVVGVAEDLRAGRTDLTVFA
jgi:hypothetical protein